MAGAVDYLLSQEERRDKIDRILNDAGIYHYKNDTEREKVITSWDNSGLSIEQIKDLHVVTEEQLECIKQSDNYKQFSKEAVLSRFKEFSQAGVL